MSTYLPENAFDAGRLIGLTDESGRQDTAYYLQQRDIYFLRPWLAVPGGLAFIWPVGIEGLDLNIDPTLGIHKYINDDKVEVNVVHRGQENTILTGNLPGIHSAKMMEQLRSVVYADTPVGGKILFLPGILKEPQRVTINNARFTHTEGDLFADIGYSLDCVRMGASNAKFKAPLTTPGTSQPTLSGLPLSGGPGSRLFIVTTILNTLRKIALAKFGDTNRWIDIYEKNVERFTEFNIPMPRIPDFPIPPGTVIYI